MSQIAYDLSPVAAGSVADLVAVEVLRVVTGLNGLDSRNSSGGDGHVLEGLLDDDHADNTVLGMVLGPDGGEFAILISNSDGRLSNSRRSLGD